MIKIINEKLRLRICVWSIASDWTCSEDPLGRRIFNRAEFLFAQIFCDIRKTVIENVYLSRAYFFYLSENFYSVIYTHRWTRLYGESRQNLKKMARKSTLNRTLKFMLILCGVWPGVPCIVLCRICWIITVTFILFCHYRYFLTHAHSAEFIDLMDCMSSFLAYSKVIIKFVVFWFNQR